MNDDKKIILFDGVCNLCNTSIQFVIKHDDKDEFRYAALQSEVGQQLTSERGIDTSTVDSIVLIDPGVAYYTKSDAALEIGSNLKGYRTLSKFFKLFPVGFRNMIYDFVARNRYKWYGKQDACMIPTPELQAKFL
ncbi:thiol-disulfide oxidoreductase DCC family protein [Croceitalea sp. P059]|uniref:thiol-disulfide oxidoreductase DCC family protein n=1 Tax=Croceitalea sp. P059 TaxID=3075601 RepID=UPI002886322E|nr:thiol-disulfide oxidoreductase DCC family protein [Croceitalea sp. P059]MDT0539798.1 thiol-disulfide oxidoreductase DCC family protein [Croceitalea sp. P059]